MLIFLHNIAYLSLNRTRYIHILYSKIDYDLENEKHFASVELIMFDIVKTTASLEDLCKLKVVKEK